MRTHIEADGCWSHCSFWSNSLPYKVWTHAFCTWIELTDGLAAQGQGVTLLHRVISALLYYLEAMLHTSRSFCKYPEVGSTLKMVTKTNCTVEGNNLILKVFTHTLQILQKNTVLTPARYKSQVVFTLGFPRSHDKLLLLWQPSLDEQILYTGARAISFSTIPEILLTLLRLI